MIVRRLLPSLLLAASLEVHGAPTDPEAEGDWAVVLGQQLEILQRQPEDSRARHAARRAAMRLGLFAQAAALAAPLEEAERRAMEGDLIAQEIRYGIIDANTLRGPARFARLDAVLVASAAPAGEFLAGRTPDAEAQRRLTDRVSALSTRRRAADAVALYEAMGARGLAIPTWTKRDVAGSYLQLRQPKPAVALYSEVVAASPDDFDANLGLFYALVEAEELDAATAHIDAYAARLPERRHRDGRYNGERLSADVTTDQVRIYADRLEEARQRILPRHEQIPYNSEARSAAASLALSRGWPHLGEQMLRRVLGSDPDNPGVHADLAEARLALQDWPAARASLAEAQRLDAEHVGVRRATQSFALHDRHELYVDSGFGKGANSSFLGNQDWHIDSYLYSRPLAENWRIFAHNYTSRADFDGATTTWSRTGLGVEWRRLDWRLAGEANGGDGVKAGLSGSARWKPGDHWTLYASGESVTNQIPLRAVRDGVHAARAELGIDWRAHESRKLAAATSASDFSDGNRRNTFAASWFERWFSAPRWLFETTLGGDASRNSLDQSVSYFNPKSDRSAWLTAAVENLVWRSYDHSLRQRLALTGGRYWQKDYDAGSIEAIEYGHRWEVDRDLTIRYSIGRSLRPYDGEREGRTFATLNFLWRF
jgi:biofilm PGA synthesis protein PgaA